MADERAGFHSVQRAVSDLAEGRPVVVVDDEDRENEGDLVFAAELATTELMAFMVRHTSGFVCVPMSGDECDRLALPPMCASNQDKHGTAYTVTVDAKRGIGTGISAADRAATIRGLADPRSVADNFTRPGHVVPLRACDGGVLRRRGHTEAAVDLVRMAGLRPVGVICEIVSRANVAEMAHGAELHEFARDHGLTIVSIADLVAFRRQNETQVAWGAEARIPTTHGEFRAVGFTAVYDDASEHVALVYGDVTGARGEGILVQEHLECVTGDIFGSLRCDCRALLDLAMQSISEEGSGVIVYLRGGLAEGMAQPYAYQLRDSGADVGAPELASCRSGSAHHELAARVLVDLGVSSVHPMISDAGQRAEYERCGLRVVDRTPIQLRPQRDGHAHHSASRVCSASEGSLDQRQHIG
jgi:3,4-dihydroxy 2-butanone 4-phosphate synthase / GTP cyclohydrolase II